MTIGQILYTDYVIQFLIDSFKINNRHMVRVPRIIVVPILKNVEETIVGIIISRANGLKIPPVR